MYVVGIDFDNTIVCYDQVFHKVALVRGLITPNIPISKGAIRDHLRLCGNEDEWTKMQGYVYSIRLHEAPPFPGVLAALSNLTNQGIQVCIISHKTRFPYKGPKYDLHLAAHKWLQKKVFFNSTQIGLSQDLIFLELTKADKLDRISRVGCTHFIDDLPEFLNDPSFPTNVQRILFDPEGKHSDSHQFLRFTSWIEIAEIISPKA